MTDANYVAWFRDSPDAGWVELTSAPTQAEAFRLLVNLTRGKGKPDAERFVTRGESPDKFFRRLKELRHDSTAPVVGVEPIKVEAL